MDKEEVLGQLRAAKAAHINWVQKAKLLISGFKIGEESIPVNSTECKFGKWFYSDAQKLNGLNNNPLQCMDQIEELHFKLHDIYLNIYKVYYDTQPRGFFSKLFGRKKKISDDSKKLAAEYFVSMQDVSKELVKNINTMERRISATSAAEFKDV